VTGRMQQCFPSANSIVRLCSRAVDRVGCKRQHRVLLVSVNAACCALSTPRTDHIVVPNASPLYHVDVVALSQYHVEEAPLPTTTTSSEASFGSRHPTQPTTTWRLERNVLQDPVQGANQPKQASTRQRSGLMPCNKAACRKAPPLFINHALLLVLRLHCPDNRRQGSAYQHCSSVHRRRSAAKCQD
jgi:hypothetical protein